MCSVFVALKIRQIKNYTNIIFMRELNMGRIIILILFASLVNIVYAQKTLTVHYNNGTKTVVDLANSDSLVIFICGASKVHYEGKAYNTVLIGNQCWLKENLDVGIMIQGNSNQTNNSVIEKYCYNNSASNCSTYGGLYQWDEAMQYVETEGVKGICPDGWHIPTYAEFQTLKAYVNSDGNALKEVGQGVDGGAGTNSSGFSALLVGDRHSSGGFYNLGYYAYMRTSTYYSTIYTSTMSLKRSSNTISIGSDDRLNGISVRCLKD
jgi:uncharacterized protein (TIGR02145 family)